MLRTLVAEAIRDIAEIEEISVSKVIAEILEDVISGKLTLKK